MKCTALVRCVTLYAAIFCLVGGAFAVDVSLVVNSTSGNPSPHVGTNVYAQGASVACVVEGSFAAFSPREISEDFETGGFSNWSWVNTNARPWVIVTNPVHAGSFAAKSGLIGNSSNTSISITLNCSTGKVYFWRKVSSESGYDELAFVVDNVTNATWSGELGWAEVTNTVTAGTHTFRWTYFKDVSGSGGVDTAWIDDIRIPIVITTEQSTCSGWVGTGSVPASGTTTNTGSFTMAMDSSITWLWDSSFWLDTEATDGGSVNVADGWRTGGVAVAITATPLPGYRFSQWSGDVPGGSIYSNPLNLLMDQARDVTAEFELDVYDLVVASSYGTPSPPVGAYVLDAGTSVVCTVAGSPASSGQNMMEGFESGDLSTQPWVNTNGRPWYVVASPTHSGSFSARAGTIGNTNTTSLDLTIECAAGTMSFWYRTSSEGPSYDGLTFTIDGVGTNKWCGVMTNWATYSRPVSAGIHTFRWTYFKDTSVSSGQDTAWIDDISIPVPQTNERAVCVGWTGSGSVPASGSTTNTGSITIGADSTITWNWDTQYQLDTGADPSGSVDVADGWYSSNATVVITATALPGNHFVLWSGDVPVENVYDNPLLLTMNQPRAIVATFAAGTGTYYTITATSGANGAITPSGNVAVIAGANRIFTMTPDYGYAVAGVTADGSPVGASNTYTFVNVMANHTISVTFSQNAGPMGTPATWFQTYNLSGDLATLELADPDGDGLLTWQEYVTGTDPTNRSSVLAVTVVRTGTAVRVSFPCIRATGADYASKARYYAIQHATNSLATGTNVWPWQAIPGYTGIFAGADGTIAYTNASPTKAFYRARAWLEQ